MSWRHRQKELVKTSTPPNTQLIQTIMLPQRLLSKVAGSPLQAVVLGSRTQRRSFATQIEATVARYYQFGKTYDVLKVEKEVISGDLKPNEVLVRMEAAPINPADINIIEGAYGTKPTFPAIAGLEGVGTIQAVGSGVKDLSVNDRVIPAQPGFGTWRTHAVAPSEQLIKIASDIPLHAAASLSVNPATAYRLLTDYGLKSGDTIIQNGANSMVGQSIIQIAKLRGIRTINVVREKSQQLQADTVALLQNLGADIVVTDKYLRTPDFKRTIADLPKPKVAFNCVGGESATELARNLADGGTLITYGAMGRQPISLPNSLFIFRDIHARGFWLTKWVSEHSKEERTAMINELVGMVRDKKLRLYVLAHRFSDLEVALKKNAEPTRNRKIVLELTH